MIKLWSKLWLQVTSRSKKNKNTQPMKIMSLKMSLRALLTVCTKTRGELAPNYGPFNLHSPSV